MVSKLTRQWPKVSQEIELNLKKTSTKFMALISGNKISQNTMRFAKLNHSEEDSVISEQRSLLLEERDGKELKEPLLIFLRHQRNKVDLVTVTQSSIGHLKTFLIILHIIKFFITHFTPKDIHQLVTPKIQSQFQMTVQSDSAQKPSSSSVTSHNGLAMDLKEKVDSLDSQQPKMGKQRQSVVSISKEKVKTTKEIFGTQKQTSLSSLNQKIHLTLLKTQS